MAAANDVCELRQIFTRCSAAVATSREDHRKPRLARAGPSSSDRAGDAADGRGEESVLGATLVVGVFASDILLVAAVHVIADDLPPIVDARLRCCRGHLRDRRQ